MDPSSRNPNGRCTEQHKDMPSIDKDRRTTAGCVRMRSRQSSSLIQVIDFLIADRRLIS